MVQQLRIGTSCTAVPIDLDRLLIEAVGPSEVGPIFHRWDQCSM
uniref:Uncharacterized protein n=1 Tax=Arundo donax TaxID=35708 RepID=A0A0A8XXQ5_ARUDO